MADNQDNRRPPARFLSFVVPVYNERESLVSLYDEISGVMAAQGSPYEIIFVDDGSTDGAQSILADLSAEHPEVLVIEFRRNFGKSAALDAGFAAASGGVIFTMDGDLQDDPVEIPRFLAKIDEGFDVVSGWKETRHDPVDKTAPSKFFNFVVSKSSGLALHDFNCGFKAYRAEAAKELTLYGELHRFIPVLLHWRGFKVGEIPVNHRARRFGSSKFGAARLFKGAMDLLTVILNTRYQTRPLHIFGLAGTIVGATGLAILTYLTVLWFMDAGAIGTRPLFFLGILLSISSMQFFTVGLLGEFIQSQASGSRPAYCVRRTLNLNPRAGLDSEAGRLKDTPQLMKDAEQLWSNPQPSGSIRPGGTGENTPTKACSTG